MKTQDIKNIASAYMQVQEKAKMDPVNPDELKGTHAQRKDKDIDNDGDVDKSDEYLHNRRKAVKTAMKKEEVEEAYSDAHRAKMAKSYKGKNPHHINAMSSDKGTMTIVTNNGNKYTVTAKETGGKMPKTGDHINKWKPGAVKEEVELDELSKKTLGSYVKKAAGNMAGNAAVGAAQASSSALRRSSPEVKRNIKNRMTGIAKATDKLTKEEVEISEDISKMSHSRLKWHMNTGVPHGSYTKDEMKKERDRRMKHTDSADAYKKAKPMLEDVDMSMKEKLQLQKESILEREMTDAEMKKREDIVKGMKKNKADLEKRYGSRWKDVMYATATKQAMESVDDALKMTKNLLTTKESFKTENTTWPVYKRIKEANDRAMHYKGATPPETMDDKLTASDKAFLAPHGELKGNDSGIDGAKAAEYTAKNATTGIKPGGGMNRTGDQKTGDKNIIKSTEAK